MKIKVSQRGIKYWSSLDEIFDPDHPIITPKADPVPPKPVEPERPPEMDYSSVRAQVRALTFSRPVDEKALKDLVEVHGRPLIVALYREEMKKRKAERE